MKKVLIAAMCMLSMSAMAESKPYFGVQYAAVTYSEPGYEADPTALVLRIGQKVNKNFAFEGRIGMGIGDDTSVIFGVPVALEVDNFFGIYARGIAPIGESAEVYAVLGYTDGEITASAGGFSLSVSDSDTSIGFGIDIMVSKDASVNIEFMNYIDKDGGSLEAISVGGSWAF